MLGCFPSGPACAPLLKALVWIFWLARVASFLTPGCYCDATRPGIEHAEIRRRSRIGGRGRRRFAW
jgi:hypothetical protein